jgi:hypothetical protein
MVKLKLSKKLPKPLCGALQPENLGLSLAEAKTLLHKTQSTLIEQQVAAYLSENSSCPHCKNQLLHKDKRTIVYRTLFGKLHIQSHLLNVKCFGFFRAFGDRDL